MLYPKNYQASVSRMVAIAIVGCLLPIVGCDDSKELAKPPPAPPPVTYKGPKYLIGTVGSMTSLRGYEPQLVSGYGLVVDLNGTGAGSCPPFLRQWMLGEMRKGGMGSAKFGTRDLLPERVLADTSSAVVAIEGIIPPGAKRGSRFDVLVSALPGTQTTSLEGGRLYTFNLSNNGLNPELRFTRPLAEASGSVYIDPLADPKANDKHVIQDRQAVILAGGIVKETRQIELVLNQPSWSRSRVISDAINARFVVDPRIDREDIAVPVNDSVIRINIPRAYVRDPGKLVRLLSRVFVQKSNNFEMTKAEEVGALIQADPKTASDVALIWIGLGKTALPVISQYYDHPRLDVRLAALAAGVNLGDQTTIGDDVAGTRIMGLVNSPDPALRQKAAGLLVDLPTSLRGSLALKKLLDDPDQSVRVAAYETLGEVGDPLVQRLAFTEENTPKFILDMVPSKQPLVYITQGSFPRVVIFNPLTGFASAPSIFKIWNNRLMLRLEDPPAREAQAKDAPGNTIGNGPPATDSDVPKVAPARVFFQARDQTSGTTYEIAPTVANLVFLLGHQTTVENETKGLNLTYSQVVSALFLLHQSGAIKAEFKVQSNPIAEAIAKTRVQTDTRQRPETEFAEINATQPGNTLTNGEAPKAVRRDYTNDDDPSVHSITPSQAWQNSDPSLAPDTGNRPPVMPAP